MAGLSSLIPVSCAVGHLQAKALADKNQRDLDMQIEQAEKQVPASTLSGSSSVFKIHLLMLTAAFVVFMCFLI